MRTIKRMEGFREQRLLVLPEYVQKELAETALTRSLYVSDIGFFPHAEHHYRERPEGADAHIFIYCINGEGGVEKNKEASFHIQPGNLLVIPAGTPHRYWASETAPWSIYWFHLKGSHVQELIRLYSLDDGPKPLPGSFAAEFVSCLNDLLAILTDRPYAIHAHVHVAQTMRWLISELGLRLHRIGPERQGDQHLENAIRYMTEHVTTTIKLPELAKSIGLSKQHLIHLFKKETGFPPIDYFLRMKMQHAANMLDLTDLTIKQVAAHVGVTDPYYFSRLFKKLMGSSPTEYRSIPKG